MNIDKQDERLLHEILSKYKQGIISGLYPGTNITFTPTGCRDKIISSTSSGIGGGIQSIQEGDNITVDNTDPLNPIVSASGGGSSGLFPNGYEIVETSRDFLITDKGKILLLGEGVTVTLPDSPTIFTTGDVVGIYVGSSTSSYNRGNGADTFPCYENDKSELVVLTYLDGDFTDVSSFPVDDSGIRKTALKYLYDNLGFRGTATLSSGTVTVATDKVLTGYKIYVSVNTPSGTQGILSAPTGSIVDETEFVINSTSATDDSTVNWWIAP